MGVRVSPGGGCGQSFTPVGSKPKKRAGSLASRLGPTRLAIAGAAAADVIGLLGGTSESFAQTVVGTWNVTPLSNAGGNWSGTPTNWLNSIVPGNPGDTANFTENITSASTITLNANESVGTLNIGPDSAAYSFAGPGTLTFDSGAVNTAAYLSTLPGNNNTTTTLSAPINLDSNLYITNGNLKAGSITLSGSIVGNGSGPGNPNNSNNAINFHGEGNGAGASIEYLAITGNISNVSAIRNLYGTSDSQGNGNSGYTLQVSGNISNGSSNLELDSYADGAVRVTGIITTSGGLTVNGPGSLQAMSPIQTTSYTGEVALAGPNAVTGATSVNAAYLYLDYSVTGGNNNKIDPLSALTLNSSYLGLNGATAGTTQVINGLVVGGGANEIKLTANTGAVTFNTGSGAITRNGYATLDFSNAATAATIVLGSSSAMVNGILPAWVTVDGADWATVNGTGQIIALPSASYTTTVPTSGTTPTLNYKAAAGTTLTGALSANSLVLTAGGTENLGGSNLTLTSGGLILSSTGNNPIVQINGSGGALVAGSTGTGELVLDIGNSVTFSGTSFVNTNLLQINTPISAGSLTKTGAGEVLLNNSSALPTGQVTINQGTLSLAGGLGVSGNNFALNSGGALGLTGSFTGAIGSGNGQVQFGAGGGGFSAVGGPLTVNFNGAGSTVTSSQLNGTLVLNNLAATNPITLVNPININTAGLTISVGESGSISGQATSVVNLGNGGYSYALVGAISGSGDLHVQGSPNGTSTDAPSGLLVPTGPLTYTGVTLVSGTALYATPNAASLPATTSLELSNNGVLATSGTFNWPYGAGAGRVTFGAYAGFAAIGGPLNVLLGNSTTDPHTSTEDMTLGSPFAGNSVNYQNNITNNSANIASSGPVPNVLSGLISGAVNFSEIGGGGMLYIPGVNTFTGTWSLGNNDAFLKIGSGNNTSTGSLDSSLGLAGTSLATGTSGWNISNGGTGYTNGNGQTLTLTPSTAGGTAAVATYNVSGNAVTYFAITTAGNGFYNAPTITIPGGSGATIVANNATAWFSGNTVAGGLDLNGTTTSEPISLATNKSSFEGANVLNSNTSSAATINGDIFIGTGGPNIFGGPGNIVVNGDVYGNVIPPFFKYGAGTLTLNGTNYEGGAGSTGSALNLDFNLYGGSVVLNYGTNNTNKIGANGTGYMTLENVSLQINGSNSATTTQSIGGTGGTKLFLGGNTISVVANGSQNATLNLGPISRLVNGTTLVAGTADFQTTNGSGGGVASITTSTANIAGVLAPTLTSGGNYTSAPAVTFNTPASGTAAKGFAIWNSSTGAVTGVIITDPGAGYSASVLPTITFSTSTGSGAAATGNFGTYGYLGGWATFGGGSSFATGATVAGTNTSIGAVANSSYGTIVAPGKLLDVGTGNGGGGASYSDALGNTFGANGIGDYTSGSLNGSNIGATVGAIRFNSFSSASTPVVLQLASIGGGNPSLFIGDSDNTIGGGTGDAAGGILDTANTGNASGGAPSVITGAAGSSIQFGNNGNFTIEQYNTAQPLQINTVVNGTSSGEILVKTGPGELQFTRNVNAAINVFGGMVTANNAGSMGASITLGGGTTFKYAAINIVNSGVTGGSAASYANTVTLDGAATFDNESGSPLSFTNTGNDFTALASGPWDLTVTGNTGGDLILSGGLSIGSTYTEAYTTTLKSIITPGFGQLIKNGSNNLVINGTSTISGGVTINNGIVVLGNASDTLPNNEPVTINANVSAGTTGTLAIGNGSFDAVGPITLNGGSITGNNTGEGNYSGTGTLQGMAYNFNAGNVSANLTGIVGIYKAGVGTVNISSGSNTYTGTTVITAGTLLAGATNTLSPLSAINVSGGTLDVSGYNNSIPSLVVGTSGALNLGTGVTLTDTGTASLLGTLDIIGAAPSSSPFNLMSYTSETGNFNTVTGTPAGYKLVYGALDLQLVVSGPANLTWDNAGGTGDGITWDTVMQNWNNGSAVTTYSNNSNTSSGDNVTFNDTNNGHYNVSISGMVSPSSTTFNNSTGNYTVTGLNGSGGIAGPGSLTKFGTGTVALSSSNTYTGGTNINAGTLILASASAFPSNTSLNISAGAQVTIANHSANATYVPTMSVLNNNGTIDITNNAMVIHNGSIGTLSAEIALAYSGGSWTGTNAGSGVITSSVAAGDTSHLTAVGVASGLTSFEGSTVLPTDVLVKYTYYGDANLDGHVDGTDYSRIDNGYLNNLTGWYNGDFNYDGIINGSDYTLIDNSYNTQGAAIAAELSGSSAVATAQVAGTSAVPEPTTLGLLGIGAVGLLGRRSRNRQRTR